MLVVVVVLVIVVLAVLARSVVSCLTLCVCSSRRRAVMIIRVGGV